MALACCLVLTLVLVAYIFLPPKTVVRQRQKTRSEYLAERRAALNDNLRDLAFEHRAGKYRDEDFERERMALAEEEAALDDEVDRLDGRPSGVRSR